MKLASIWNSSLLIGLGVTFGALGTLVGVSIGSDIPVGWEPIVGSFVGVVGVYLAASYQVRASSRQEEERRARQRRATRASMTHDILDVHNYVERAFLALPPNSNWNTEPDDSDDVNFMMEARDIEPVEGAILARLANAVREIAPHEGEQLADLLGMLQVYQSRHQKGGQWFSTIEKYHERCLEIGRMRANADAFLEWARDGESLKGSVSTCEAVTGLLNINASLSYPLGENSQLNERLKALLGAAISRK